MRSLPWLLEGVEDCCEGKFREPFRRVWNEGGRSYKLELRSCSNKTGRFLLCSAVCIEEKRFSLVFLEGKAPQGDWKILASNLRSIGVVPLS